MVLDREARGELEKYIDYFIRSIPQLMSRFREKKFKNLFHYKSEEDFLYGVVYGGIIWGYGEKFFAIFHRHITQEEVFEIQNILVKRMREVRNAIFGTG